MIRFSTGKDKETLYQLYKTYANYDQSKLDYLFNELFDLDDTDCLMIESNGQILGALFIYHDMYRINNQNIRISTIDNPVFDENYNDDNTLIKSAIDILSHQELITFMHSDKYQNYGFEKIYYKNYYLLKRDPKYLHNFGKITNYIEIEDLLSCYGRFTRLFHGFKIRFAKDYENILKRHQYFGGKTMTYYENGLIKAYMFYHIEDDRAVVDEIIYYDLKALNSLIAYLFKQFEYVEVKVSESEKLEAFFNVVSKQIKPDTVARLNDIELFNELYQCDVKNACEAFKIANKPLYKNEEH